MSTRICIALGQYAATPYVIAGLEIPVRSIEELCYLFRENAVLIDQSVMSRSLVDWIQRDLHLPDLADMLYPLVQRQGSLSSFVGIIEEYVGLYEEETQLEISRILKKGAGLSKIERLKRQIDYLVEKRHYDAAVRGYRGLIGKWEEVRTTGSGILPGEEVLCAIHHNLGVAYTGMMKYARAAEEFERSYELSRDEDELLSLLAAKRLELGDKEYVAYCAEHPRYYEVSMDLEKRLQRLKKEWKEGEQYRALEERKVLRDSQTPQTYYDRNEQVLTVMKERYRESAGA